MTVTREDDDEEEDPEENEEDQGDDTRPTVKPVPGTAAATRPRTKDELVRVLQGGLQNMATQAANQHRATVDALADLADHTQAMVTAFTAALANLPAQAPPIPQGVVPPRQAPPGNPPHAPPGVQPGVIAPLGAQLPAGFANPSSTGDQLWDFTSAMGLKIYTNSMRPLCQPLYGGSPEDLTVFLNMAWNRAVAYGLEENFRIPDATGTIRRLDREYGQLTRADLRAQAAINLYPHQKLHQASQLIKQMVTASVTNQFLGRLHVQESNFSVSIDNAAFAPRVNAYHDGPCMLFELIKLVAVDTRATIDNLDMQLNRLPQLMQECHSDVELFNQKVQIIIDALTTRGAALPRLLPRLIDGYIATGDADFTRYIKNKRDLSDDNQTELDVTTFMFQAMIRYKTQKLQNDWMKSGDKELDFVAMAVQAKLKQNGKAAAKKGTKAKFARNTGPYAWKAIPPKAGESHDKKFKGKEYIYCPHHGDTAWVLKVNSQNVDHRTGCTEASKMKEAQQEEVPLVAMTTTIQPMTGLDSSDEENM